MLDGGEAPEGKANREGLCHQHQSIIRSLQGVGLMATSSGRVMLAIETIAWPGAKFGSPYGPETGSA
jgi:hypothetical protein